MPDIQLKIIGYHRSCLKQKFGTPRQPNLVDVSSVIEFEPPFDTPSAFVGIEQFSHLWIIWQFHQNKTQNNFRPQVRPPRLGGNEKMGVFATRSMYRPSNLGLSVVRLQSVEIQQNKVRLHIVGADMVDGTPIVDIKPYLHYADSICDAHSGKMQRPNVRQVHVSDAACEQLQNLVLAQYLQPADKVLIQQLIAQDPRPAYKQHQSYQNFMMRYGNVDVCFFMDHLGNLVIDRVVLVDCDGLKSLG